jgi:hypothetical protein
VTSAAWTAIALAVAASATGALDKAVLTYTGGHEDLHANR